MTTPEADAELLQLFQDETTHRLDDMDSRQFVVDVERILSFGA